MRALARFLGTVLTATALALVGGCGPSPSPPGVTVAVPVADDSGPERPEAAPALRNLGAAVAAKGAEPVPVSDGGAFPFPDDAGGKALAKMLAPAPPPPMPAATPVAPRERKPPEFLTNPSPPPPGPTGTLPRLPLPAAREVRPTPLPDQVPVDLGGVSPELPPRGELTTGPLTRTEGRDVSNPVELPLLSNRPVPDRAPLTDPTAEFTARSVISLGLPLRVDPAGFVRINVPDPFEHADAARPRTPVVEDPNRALGSPPPPRK